MKKQLTQQQFDDLKKLVPSTNEADYEIVESKVRNSDELMSGFMGVDDYDFRAAASKATREDEEKKREDEKREREEKIAQGYEEKTTTEYVEEWDGEGGEWVTYTEWVKKEINTQETSEETVEGNYSPTILEGLLTRQHYFDVKTMFGINDIHKFAKFVEEESLIYEIEYNQDGQPCGQKTKIRPGFSADEVSHRLFCGNKWFVEGYRIERTERRPIWLPITLPSKCINEDNWQFEPAGYVAMMEHHRIVYVTKCQ